MCGPNGCSHKAKVLVKWYDEELKYEDSEILENISPGDAITVVSEGNEHAIDIRAELLPHEGCGRPECKCEHNDPLKNTVKRGYVILEAVDPEISREDINAFFIGGYEFKGKNGDMQFDWDDSESVIIDATVSHNLRIESTLRNYNLNEYPGYGYLDLKDATQINEVHYEAYFYNESTGMETDNVKLKLVNFTIENEAGEEFSIAEDLIDRFNSQN